MRILLVVSFLALTATASAQGILITPKMRAGDTFKLEISRARENTPASPQDGKGSTTIDVTVLTATPEGFTIQWESGLTTGSVAGLPEALMLTTSNAMRGMKPVIRLTPDGEVAGLVNETEVLTKMQAAVDIIRRDLVEKMPLANRQELEAILVPILSPPILIASAVRDAATYFGLNGAELAVGESLTADLMQQNPLGGESLPTKFTVRVESATADTALLATTTVYDGDALMRTTRQLLEKAGNPVSPEELAKFPAMQLADQGRFVFDRGVGLMREAVIIRRFSVAGQSRLDRTEIRLAVPPKR
jgi:hypothetical protein